MADLKISQLPSATTPLAGTEVLPIVQSSATKQVSIANLTAGRSVSVANATLTTGNLVIGTSGKGIDFSANSGSILTQYKQGTAGSAFTVTATNLTVVGGTGVTYTTNYTQIGNVVFFRLEIGANGGTTASVANSTYFQTSLPGAGNYGPVACANASSATSYGNGIATGTYIYPPTWAATNGTVVISGTIILS